MKKDPRKRPLDQCGSIGDLMAHTEECRDCDREDLQTFAMSKRGSPQVLVNMDGWGFWDETYTSFIGPFPTEWEAEKILSMYCFDIKGVGDAPLLYIDTLRAVKAAKGVLKYDQTEEADPEREKGQDQGRGMLEVRGEIGVQGQRPEVPRLRVPLQSKIVLDDMGKIVRGLLEILDTRQPTPAEVGAIEMILECHRQYRKKYGRK